MKKHWSEVLACSCGMRFRSALAEARHRHNYPLLCRQKKARKLAHKCPDGALEMTYSDPQKPTAGQ
jgi:hypothetical protein